VELWDRTLHFKGNKGLGLPLAGRQTYPEGQIQPAPSGEEVFCEVPDRAQAHTGMSAAH